ncbi:MAG: hypothetical protein JWP82_3094 [Humibacillus sp.]|nr:hypothetical protein [Humibacillus sp.]
MAFGEQMKNKADEVHLQDKAKDFGDAVADVVKEAVGLVAGFAQDNRPKVDEVLDKAQTTLAQTNGGKHADTVTKVRASVDKGIDKLVEHTTTDARPEPTVVPEDRHSAFDEDPAGSPS